MQTVKNQKSKLTAMWLLAMGITMVAACKQKQDAPQASAPETRIIIEDPALLAIVDTASIIEVLAEGFNWSEGPLWLEDQNKLIFTDVPENTVYSWGATQGKQVYLTPSGYTELIGNEKREGANGLALDTAKNLVLCQHGNRRVARMDAPLARAEAKFVWLAETYKGKKFNSPNDLHIMSDGDIFFTDPPYGLPGGDTDPEKELEFNGVFRLSPNGEVYLLDSTLTRPNGIIISPDGRSMIVANSDPEKALWMWYDLNENRQVSSKKIWADMTDRVKAGKKGLPDGLKLSRRGHIFATGPGGVLVFAPDGRCLGTIDTGQATANCALDADEKYLYMTADNYLMRVRLK